MSKLTWQEKLHAFNALAECDLKMRKPGDWYVSCDVSVKSGSVLVSLYGNGQTPEYAVLDHWEQLCETLKPDQYLVTRASGKRRAVRWAEFMWKDVTEATEES